MQETDRTIQRQNWQSIKDNFPNKWFEHPLLYNQYLTTALNLATITEVFHSLSNENHLPNSPALILASAGIYFISALADRKSTRTILSQLHSDQSIPTITNYQEQNLAINKPSDLDSNSMAFKESLNQALSLVAPLTTLTKGLIRLTHAANNSRKSKRLDHLISPSA